MSDAWIGVAGSLSGVAIGFVGSYFVGLTEEKRREAREFARTRMAAYISLLDGCRQLRYAARRIFEKGEGPNEGEIDKWRTQASVAAYDIEILSPRETAGAANIFLRNVLDYLDLALKSPTASNWETFRLTARGSGHDFVNHVRRELGAREK